MKHTTIRHLCLAGVMLLCSTLQSRAQDTLRITLPEAEKQFTEKNLQLLAEHYNIHIAKAAEMQAKLYDNPTLSIIANAYDPQRNKIFNVSNKNGQYDIALQQIIRLAGKRNKEIKLAQINTSISERNFFDLLRTLRYELRSNFYESYYLQRSVTAYSVQILSVEKLNAAYEQLQSKGTVTMKDAMRIRSLLYSLKAEQISLLNKLNEVQASLRLLLQDNKTWFTPMVSERITSEMITAVDVQSLIDTAYKNRSDLQIAQRSVLYHQQNLNLQKALAKPDLTLGAEFDKRGSFVDNASFLTIAMDLPFFKRNQGNIRAAKFGIEQSKILVQQQQQTVESEVQLAYSKLLNTDKMLSSIDTSFENTFEKLLAGVTENFQKKNISLIEFTDFYESYKENVLQLNQLRDDKMQAIEALHFAVGKTIFTN
ncbi:TolC family protein [Ferruginibacter sp. HRS2-29]|uniref:TolC family protein n=1 Tax=Ferruginibacter sp. HRS2-29 TaxID=2487334 RepID=UPI0020CED8A9|nr:TolC family protein [Ferruginibacter sp. HRS2-29]MCP9750824.1 TolC family protein [Ferruginibacter sp. HRS2-29]